MAPLPPSYRALESPTKWTARERTVFSSQRARVESWGGGGCVQPKRLVENGHRAVAGLRALPRRCGLLGVDRGEAIQGVWLLSARPQGAERASGELRVVRGEDPRRPCDRPSLQEPWMRQPQTPRSGDQPREHSTGRQPPNPQRPQNALSERP